MPQQSPMCSPAGERRRVSENQKTVFGLYKNIGITQKDIERQDVGMMHKNIGAIKFWSNAGKC